MLSPFSTHGCIPAGMQCRSPTSSLKHPPLKLSRLFSDTEGPLLLDFKSLNDKINANRYCQNLQKAAKHPVYGPNLPHCDLWTVINRTFEGLTSCRATMARVSVVQYLGNSTRHFLQMRYADMCNGTPVSMPVVIFSVAVPSHVDIL